MSTTGSTDAHRHATGTLRVYTFKAGLLSAVAHDLELFLREFTVDLEGDAVRAELELAQLRVVGAVVNGQVQSDLFGSSERTRIETAMREHVLHTQRYPNAVFLGSARSRRVTPTRLDDAAPPTAVPGGFLVDGTLQLAGVSAPIAFEVQSNQGSHRGVFELNPSRWKISPYRALLGAIQLQDRVRIEFELNER